MMLPIDDKAVLSSIDDTLHSIGTMRIRTPQDIGLTIRERRLQLGIDQSDLARRVGVSRQWLVEIEKGKPRAEIGLVLRTLRELDLDVWLGDLPSTESQPAPEIDLNRVIERARGANDDE
jgi:HTH-type transcriptional regulator/antitoxin HipB